MAEGTGAGLLDRRLVLVTGKGGTGKTTLSAALGLAAARRGRRVLVAELGRDEQLVPLLAPGSPPAGYAGRDVAPGLRVMRIDPYEALAEYLGLQIGMKGVVARVLRNRAFRQLMEAAPGWRDLITLGKVWHLTQMQDAPGRPRFDLLIVDAPATGHGVAFLNVPRVVVSAVRAGPLHRNAQLVEAMLEDSQRTLLLPVALPEELPARETAQLVERVRRDVGIAIDRVVVNAVVEPPFPPGLEDLDAMLARLPADARFGALPGAGELARCAAFLRARHELGRTYVRLLAELTRLPLVSLAYRPEGVEGVPALASLGEDLLAAPGPPA
jgi:anion-transporting  ArsA/GET3 family ATPase